MHRIIIGCVAKLRLSAFRKDRDVLHVCNLDLWDCTCSYQHLMHYIDEVNGAYTAINCSSSAHSTRRLVIVHLPSRFTTTPNASKPSSILAITTPHSPPSSTLSTSQAERRLRWKIDLCIVPVVAVLYALCTIDRVNIGNARLVGFEISLNLRGNDFNALLSIFYVSYILCSVPATWVTKWIGPGWVLPGTTLVFGVLTVCFAFVETFAQAAAVRFLLGIFEAGLFGGCSYYMSRWYRRSELAFRLSLYIVMAPLSGAASGLLASAILKLDHFGSTRGWRMIFAIEGIITIALALMALVIMTDRPETARWLTPEEKALATARVQDERVAVTEAQEAFDIRKALKGLGNPVVLFTAISLGLVQITIQGISFFTPTVVRSIYPDRSVIAQQLYSVPPFAVGAFFTVALSGLSWRLDRRNIVMILGALISLAGYTMFMGSTATDLRYGAMFVGASGCFLFGSLANAQASANVVSDTARSSALGLNTMMGNVGGLIATWSYLPRDAPRYDIATGLNIATLSTVVLTLALLGLWMRRDNRKRDTKQTVAEEALSGLNAGEKRVLDNEHPLFRWST